MPPYNQNVDNSLSLAPSLELSLLGMAVEDSDYYGIFGLPAPNRSFSSIAFFFWGMLSLLLGMMMLAQGISLSQKDHALADLDHIYSNGAGLYILVFLLFLYSLLQLVNIFRLYGILFVEFVSILGIMCCFLCGSMAWFSLQVPRAAWAELDKSTLMCEDFSVFCTGIHLMFVGSLLSILGILLLQPHQLYLLHLSQPLSPWNMKKSKKFESLSEVEVAAAELEGAGIEDHSVSEAAIGDHSEDDERIGRFWITSIATFKFLHGGLVLSELVAFLLFLVGIVMHVQTEANTEYNKNGAIDLCILVLMMVLGILFSVSLLLEHSHKLYNYHIVYVLNILNVCGLGLAFFLSGGCSLVFVSSTSLCQPSSLLLFSTCLLLIFFIMDEALLIVSVAFGAIDVKLRDETLGELSSLYSMFDSFVKLGSHGGGRDPEGFEEDTLEDDGDGNLPPMVEMRKFSAYSNL